MAKYTKKNGALFDRRILNKLFGQKSGRTNAECWGLEKFVRKIITGSGWECKTWHDFAAFNKHFDATNMWRTWLTVPTMLNSTSLDETCPVVEMRDGRPQWALFEGGERQTEWEWGPYQEWVLEGMLNGRKVPF